MRRSILALVVVGLLTIAIPMQQTEAQSPKLTVTAQLEKRDGSPSAGVKVYIFPYRDGKVLHGIAFVDGKFDLSNPHGTSDSKGRVVIEFTRDYLEQHKTEDFCVGLFITGAVDPVVLFRDMEKSQATPILHVSVFKKRNGTLHLNDIVKKVIVE
jgi:hypothetical protein